MSDGAPIVGPLGANSTGLSGFRESRYLRISEKVPLRASRLSDGGGCFSSCSALQVIIILMSAFTVSITTALVISIYAGTAQRFEQSGIVSDHDECTRIGVDVLRNKGGTAVDASIAVSFCLAVIQPHLTGLGGGGFMLIHNNGYPTNTQVIDFVAVAPAQQSRVGVPGFVSGMMTAHKIFGKLTLKELVSPAVALAMNGVPISSSLKEYLLSTSNWSSLNPKLKELFFDSESSLKERWEWPELGQTLSEIAENGDQVFYSPPISTSIAASLDPDGDGRMTQADLSAYAATVTQPLVASINGYELLTTANSSSGRKVIDFLSRKIDSNIDVIATNLQDSFFGRNDSSGTAQQNPDRLQPAKDFQGATTSIVFDSQDVYVVTVSGLGSYFGSNIVTPTGIILNDAVLPYPAENRRRSRLPSSVAAAVVLSPSGPCGLRLAAASASGQALVQTLAPILARNWTVVGAKEQELFPASLARAVEASKIVLDDPGTLTRETVMDNWQMEEYSRRVLQEKLAVATVGRRPDLATNVGGKMADSIVTHSDTRRYGSAAKV